MRILVAEDDGFICEAFKEHIIDLGHEVVVAHDGREAMNALYPDGVMDNTITAVVTDMNMPKATGLELLQYISRKGPAVPCLLQSSLNEAVVEGKVINLVTIDRTFPFARYRPKGSLKNITEFLESLP